MRALGICFDYITIIEWWVDPASCFEAFGQGIFGIQGDLSMRYDSSRRASSIYHRALFSSPDAVATPSGSIEDDYSENKGHSMPQLGLVESNSTSDIVIAITELSIRELLAIMQPMYWPHVQSDASTRAAAGSDLNLAMYESLLGEKDSRSRY